MILELGKNRTNGANCWELSNNINFIISPNNVERTSLFVNIIKGLSETLMTVYACVGNSFDSVKFSDLFQNSRARICVLKSKENVLSNFMETVKQRKEQCQSSYTDILYIFDSVCLNHNELLEILQYPNKLLKELGVHVILMVDSDEKLPSNNDEIFNNEHYVFQYIRLRKIEDTSDKSPAEIVLEIMINNGKTDTVSLSVVTVPLFM